MTRRTIFALLSAALFALMVFAVPGAHAAADAAGVKGTVYTIDIKAKTITIKKGDASTVTVKYNAATTIVRNGKTAKIKKVLLQDSIQAQLKNKVAVKIKTNGPQSKNVAGKLSDAFKGNGTVVINGKTVHVTAETRISRNGQLVSMSRLTKQDKLVAHLKTGAGKSGSDDEALDLVGDGPEDGEVHGVISALGSNTVTVTPDNGTADVVLNVTDGTMIEIDHAQKAFGDLAVGMQVEASYDPTTNNAFSIEADSEGESNDAHIHGTVTAVDTGASTLTIAPTTGAPVTLNVDASTEIKVNDVTATLADVQVGMPAEAQYDSTSLLATEIKVGSGDDNHEDQHLNGTVAAVDTGAQTVTITPHGGGADVVLNVTTETEIEVNGEPGALGDILVGATIEAKYDPSTNNAFELKVGSDDGGGGGGGGDQNAEVEGPVTAVNMDAKTVTIDPSEGDPVTVNVTDSTEIKVNDQTATLADVTVGAQAKAEYDATSLDASELTVGDNSGGDGNNDIHGTITAKDNDLKTVTITPEHGDAVTVRIVESTEIKVNGESATFDDVTVGAQAESEYDANSLEARELNVGSGD